MLHLDAESLTKLSISPRSFQRLVVETTPPLHSSSLERLSLGQQFHLLMRQRLMELPIDSLLETEPVLKQWMRRLEKVAPYMFGEGERPIFYREWDVERTLIVEEHLLRAMPDMLIEWCDNTALLVELNVGKPPASLLEIENWWTTKLNFYIIASACAYAPEQLSLEYWFLQPDSEPVSYKFNYDEAFHALTGEQLSQMLQSLNRWLSNYRVTGQPFPEHWSKAVDVPSPLTNPLTKLNELPEITL